jgi:hypothetical protein
MFWTTLLVGALLIQAPENNPCMVAQTAKQMNPNVLYLQNEALIDPAWADEVAFEIYQKGLADPVGHYSVKVNTALYPTGNRTPYSNCWVFNYTPQANLIRDGETEYYARGRAQHSTGLRGALSSPSNFFSLTPIGQKPIPASTVWVGFVSASGE